MIHITIIIAAVIATITAIDAVFFPDS